MLVRCLGAEQRSSRIASTQVFNGRSRSDRGQVESVDVASLCWGVGGGVRLRRPCVRFRRRRGGRWRPRRCGSERCELPRGPAQARHPRAGLVLRQRHSPRLDPRRETQVRLRRPCPVAPSSDARHEAQPALSVSETADRANPDLDQGAAAGAASEHSVIPKPAPSTEEVGVAKRSRQRVADDGASLRPGQP